MLRVCPSRDLGHAAALACAATWAFATVIFGRIARTLEARALNFLKTALSALLLAVTSVSLGDLPALSALLLGCWLVVLPGAGPRLAGVRASARGLVAGAFVGTYEEVLLGTFAVRTVSAGVATTLVATTPMFAFAFVWLTGGRPGVRSILGALVALVGVPVLVW